MSIRPGVGVSRVGFVMPVKASENPLYAQIVAAVQQRISDGTYGWGELIPSESQFRREFGASRPVVVRALGILEQDGWVQAEKGRGRRVARTRAREASRSGAGEEMLRPEQAPGVVLLHVGVVKAPMRAAVSLGVEKGTPVLARRRLVTSSIGPVELATVYLPLDLAAGTDLAEARPIGEGFVQHLADRTGVQLDHATDRIGARLVTTDEADLLEVARREVVLTLLVTAFDAAGTPRLVADAVMPTTRAELEDSFPLN